MSPHAQIACEVLTEILKRMEFPGTIEVAETPEQITLTMVSDQPMGLLIGKGGQTLNAIELVVKTIVQTKAHSVQQHIVVDAEGYRDRHADRLGEIARAAVARVKETGEAVPLEPMNPRDRRTIHMVLAEIDGVESVSAGEEPFRHIVVCLPGQCGEDNKE